MKQSILKIEGLTDTKEQIINKISFELFEGDICGIVAQDETAKCLVDILTGQHRTYEGKIIIKGKNETIHSIKNARIKGIGIIFPENQLITHLSISENIVFGSLEKFINRKKILSQVSDFIKSLELNIDINASINDLKEEEKFIVDFLRVLYLNPKIIIVMKLHGLTAKTLNILRRIVNQCARKNIGFLFFSSRVDEILSIVDKVATIYNSKLSDFMRFDDIKKNPSSLVNLIIGNKVDLQKNSNELEMIETILKINELIATKHELSGVFNFIAERLAKIVNAQYCHIAFSDDQLQSIREEGYYKLIPHDLNQTIATKVIKSGQIFFNNGSMGYDSLPDLKDLNSEVRSLLIPIKVKKRILGVIQIAFKHSQLIGNEFQKILETFINQISMVLENSRLMSETNLIREAHHRIKNNLQSIVSLLILESCNTKNKVANNILEETVSRIKALAAVHEMLSYRDNLSGMVNLRDLIVFLVENMPEDPEKHGIKINIEIKNFFIQYSKATSLILVINELLVNSIKHAYPTNFKLRDKTIKVILSEKSNGSELKIIDNGVGLKKDIDIIKMQSLGMKIVDSLVRKDLDGKFNIENAYDIQGNVIGTVVTILLKNQ